MQTQHTLDPNLLKQVVDSTETATTTMLWLGLRKRAHAYTNIASVKAELSAAHEKVDDKDYMAFWRGLERAGAGSLILGRRGKNTRFQWNYSLRQVAALTIDGRDEEIKRLERKAAKLPKEVSIAIPQPQVEQVEATILTLPLTTGKAQVIFDKATPTSEIERIKHLFYS